MEVTKERGSWIGMESVEERQSLYIILLRGWTGYSSFCYYGSSEEICVGESGYVC